MEQIHPKANIRASVTNCRKSSSGLSTPGRPSRIANQAPASIPTRPKGITSQAPSIWCVGSRKPVLRVRIARTAGKSPIRPFRIPDRTVAALRALKEDSAATFAEHGVGGHERPLEVARGTRDALEAFRGNPPHSSLDALRVLESCRVADENGERGGLLRHSRRDRFALGKSDRVLGSGATGALTNRELIERGSPSEGRRAGRRDGPQSPGEARPTRALSSSFISLAIASSFW